MKPRISVALACYKGKPYIKEQLESIWKQTLLPFEVIIVDDASPDDTLSYVSELVAQAPIPTRLLSAANNQGSTATFGQAIQACQGDWIALADQDDVWLPHKLQTLLSQALKEGRQAIFSDAELVNRDLEPLGHRLWENSRFDSRMKRAFGEDAFAALLRYNVVTGATLLFNASRKDLFQQIPSPWIHDYWIALTFAAQASLGYCTDVLLLYRQHGQNQIGQKPGFAGEWNVAQAKAANLYLEEAAQFASLAAYLQSSGIPLQPKVLTQLQEKCRFLESRFTMRQRGHLRVLTWLKNVLGFRYFRYGQGWRPLLKDLLLP